MQAKDTVWFKQLVQAHEQREPGQGASELDRAIARFQINLQHCKQIIERSK